MVGIRCGGLIAVVVAGVIGLALAGPVAARAPKEVPLSADLDGKPIDLAEVGGWFCHDFDYPAIHCFSDPARLDESSIAAQTSRSKKALARGDVVAALAGVTYVTVFENTSYQGSFMNMSENYAVLSLIGWNDRISSFKVRNSSSGAFFVDWLYGGARWSFCCNQWLETLNAYDNTFSSVSHN